MPVDYARSQCHNEACGLTGLLSRFPPFVGGPMQYDYERFLRELGARVKKLRSERALTHRQMITQHGFHLNQLHRIESGDPISVQTLLKLCAAFDVTLEQLVQELGTEVDERE